MQGINKVLKQQGHHSLFPFHRSLFENTDAFKLQLLLIVYPTLLWALMPHNTHKEEVNPSPPIRCAFPLSSVYHMVLLCPVAVSPFSLPKLLKKDCDEKIKISMKL